MVLSARGLAQCYLTRLLYLAAAFHAMSCRWFFSFEDKRTSTDARFRFDEN